MNNTYHQTLPSPAGPWGSPRSLDICTVSRAGGRDEVAIATGLITRVPPSAQSAARAELLGTFGIDTPVGPFPQEPARPKYKPGHKRAGDGYIACNRPGCCLPQEPAPGNRCYACNRPLKSRYSVYTSDGQLQFVGPDCAAKVQECGVLGWQPPAGGPRLFPSNPEVTWASSEPEAVAQANSLRALADAAFEAQP